MDNDRAERLWSGLGWALRRETWDRWWSFWGENDETSETIVSSMNYGGASLKDLTETNSDREKPRMMKQSKPTNDIEWWAIQSKKTSKIISDPCRQMSENSLPGDFLEVAQHAQHDAVLGLSVCKDGIGISSRQAAGSRLWDVHIEGMMMYVYNYITDYMRIYIYICIWLYMYLIIIYIYCKISM